MLNIRVEKYDAPINEPQKVLMATDIPNGYWRIIHEIDHEPSWELLIAVNQMEIEPDFLITPNRLFVIGVEQAVFCISEQTGKIISSIADLSFVQSVEMLSKEQVAVASEDEILLLNASGNLEWRVNLPDIIEDIIEVEENLQIELVSGEKLYLNIVTGQPS